MSFDDVAIVRGDALDMLIDYLNRAAHGGRPARVVVDDGFVKVKIGEGIWSPPLGRRDAACVAAQPHRQVPEIPPPPCPACGSLRWVRVASAGGHFPRAQCVPCGRIHARLDDVDAGGAATYTTSFKRMPKSHYGVRPGPACTCVQASDTGHDSECPRAEFARGGAAQNPDYGVPPERCGNATCPGPGHLFVVANGLRAHCHGPEAPDA